MAIYDFFLSRNGAASTPQNYVGHTGRLFYNSNTGEIRISDGETAGGLPIPITVATSTVLGGVKLGPGVVLNGDGQIVIDSTGLDFSFGDFESTTPAGGAATLSSIGESQNIDIVSNGDGYINIIGNLHVHRAADYNPETPDADGAVFAVKADGQIQMKVPLSDSTTGALEIVGNDTGLFLSPNQTGVILHVTGNSGLVSRSYFDANANYALLAGRRYNGTQLAPRRVLNNEILLRLVAQAAGSATSNGNATFQTFGPARISFIANEDQTPTAQGGRIAFEVTKNGTTADAVGTNTITVARMDAQDGVTATKFNGPLTGNVTGKADTAGNAGTATNGVVTTGSYSDPSWLTISKSKVGLSAVENTALSTWAGTSYITTVGTLGSLTVTNLISAKNYNGQSRDAGTLGAAGTLTIDFATDHNVLVTLTTTATIAFSNITAGKTVTVMVKNATGNNRAVTLGVVAGNTSGGNAAPNVNDGRTGVLVYRTFGTATTDVYCEFN